MANEYPEAVRREARRLWLTGRFTDEQVAERLRIARADTIRDWRRDEGWRELANDLTTVIEEGVKRGIAAELGALRRKYDQLGQVIEGRAIRMLNNPNLTARDLKALTSTFASTVRIRHEVLGGDEARLRDRLSGTVAGILSQEWDDLERRERGEPLGRCRGGEVDDDSQPDEAITAQPTGESGHAPLE